MITTKKYKRHSVLSRVASAVEGSCKTSSRTMSLSGDRRSPFGTLPNRLNFGSLQTAHHGSSRAHISLILMGKFLVLRIPAEPVCSTAPEGNTSRHTCFGACWLNRSILFKDIVGFIGPKDFSTRNVPAEATGVTYALPLSQKSFAAVQIKIATLEIRKGWRSPAKSRLAKPATPVLRPGPM